MITPIHGGGSRVLGGYESAREHTAVLAVPHSAQVCRASVLLAAVLTAAWPGTPASHSTRPQTRTGLAAGHCLKPRGLEGWLPGAQEPEEGFFLIAVGLAEWLGGHALSSGCTWAIGFLCSFS